MSCQNSDKKNPSYTDWDACDFDFTKKQCEDTEENIEKDIDATKKLNEELKENIHNLKGN